MTQADHKNERASWASLMSKFVKDEVGNVTTLFGFSVLPMVVISGGAFDYSRAITLDQQIQQIADSAVLYGASQFGKPNYTSEALQAEVTSYINNRIDNRSMQDTTVSADVDIDSGSLSIDVSITGQVPAFFLPLAGIESLDVAAGSQAGADLRANICALALNPTAVDAIEFFGSGTVSAPNCTFWANSNAVDQAMRFQGSGSATAQGYCAVGNSLVSNYNVSPDPREYCRTIDDPMASWSPPSIPATCDFGVDGNGRTVGLTISGKSSATTLQPGRYCGDIKISAKTVELAEGEYYFTGGSVSISAQSDLSGEDVYLHMAEDVDTYKITGGSELRFTHRDEGYLNKVILYKAPPTVSTSGNQSSMAGNSHTHLEGVVYTPEDTFYITGTSDTTIKSPETMLVADKIKIGGTGTLVLEPDFDFTESGLNYVSRVWIIN